MANELSIKSQQGIVDYATDYVRKNNIILSQNYDLPRAMNSLYLNLLQVKDKNQRPALEVCSEVTIREAVMDCVNKELNVSKAQGYYIVYGDKLQFQPSYFGLSKMARDLAGVNIMSNVIREGEDADVESRIDGSLVVHHKPSIKCLNNKIVAVYAVATDVSTGRVVNSDIMSSEEAKKSLAKSKTGGTVAKEFEHEMMRKVVERRLAKHFINKSSDAMRMTITNPDGSVVNINSYDDMLDNDNFVDYSYTINTDEQIESEKEKYVPKEEDKISAYDLKLDPIGPSVDVPEGAIEIDYNLVKGGANKEHFKVVPNSFNKATYTCMAVVLDDEGKSLIGG
jgi:recombinational DNA repair protein RecT